MKFRAVVLLSICVPAAAVTIEPTASVYRVPDLQSIYLTDDGALPAAVPLVEWRRVESPQRTGSATKAPKSITAPAIAAAVAAASRRHGVLPALIEAVIATESGYRPHAVSVRGAMGLMQLMPATARSYGVVDPFDVDSNIDAGARHLRSLIDRFGADTRLVLAAYNAGAEAVARYGNRVPPFAETLAYVPRVLRRLELLGGPHIPEMGSAVAVPEPEPSIP